ncbi:MAG: cation-translocating P-type ATPase, partial [Planctomycetaceae bacterium]|nr:cation-translocating P-type ATPase [Planctomycetaceae bacterium]
IRSVPIDTIVVDDVLEVRAGDLFPVDGVVLKGNSTVDESIMTGESREIPVGVDSPVIAGTKNISGLLIIRAQQVAQQTRLAEMMRLVESGVASKTLIVQLANAIGGYFVVVVMLLALITLGIWWSSGIHLAVNHAMALLIVACPCALGLATPLTIAIAQARAARRQILIKSGEVFERLRQSGEIWIDKTGTITEGRLRLAEWQGSEKYLPCILAMERQAIHPIALALVNHFESRFQPIEEVILEEVTLQPGVGLWSHTSAGVLHVGSSILLETQAESAASALSGTMREYQAHGWSIVVAVLDGELVAVFGFTDSIRSDATSAISTLNQQGWQPGILSGDHQRAVDLVAEQIGIPPERACGQVTPEEKLERIRLATETSSVIMVGDGVNDSAALAAASVGIAVCGGASASLQAADVYLNRPGLAEIPQLIAGVRTTGRVIRLNFGISLVYNALAAGLAIAGQINPVIAAILMPVSSLTVLSVAFFNPAFGKSDS